MTGAMLKTLPKMTVDQFMDWDGSGHVGKLELVNGEVRAMSPASGTHALIQANLAYLIGLHLRTNKLPCRVGTETPVLPRLDSKANVRAPDLAVTCLSTTRGKTFPDPVLIIEVLSPSHRRETWESIWACATIPTLTEILVVDSESVHVEVYRRDAAGAWPQHPNKDSQNTTEQITLESIGADLPLAEIYAGTHFVEG